MEEIKGKIKVYKMKNMKVVKDIVKEINNL